MGRILLENIKLFGYHGCMPEEKYVGSNYTINIEIELDFYNASITDDLSKTINYVHLYSIIKKEMSINSKLIENVAQRIIEKINDKFNNLVKYSKIKLCKENPPLQHNNVDRFCIIIEYFNKKK